MLLVATPVVAVSEVVVDLVLVVTGVRPTG